MLKSKSQKRSEAEERQNKYMILTKDEKINKLNKGKFRAKKERRKLGKPEIPKDCTN